MSLELAVAALAAGGNVMGGISAKRQATRARRARRADYYRTIDAMLDQLGDVGVQGRRFAGRQRGAFAAAGVNPNTGTAAATQDISLGEMLLTQNRIQRGVAAIRHQIHREHRGSKARNLEQLLETSMGVTASAIDSYLASTSER